MSLFLLIHKIQKYLDALINASKSEKGFWFVVATIV